MAGLQPVHVGKGKTLFAPGAPCAGFVLVLEGRVRVGLTAENGRRLALYRVAPGETCVQTTLCLLGGLDYSAEGEAESDLRLVVVPPALFLRLLRECPVFSHYVFERFGARLAEMTRLIETIAFLRIDARLAAAFAGAGRRERRAGCDPSGAGRGHRRGARGRQPAARPVPARRLAAAWPGAYRADR